MGKNFKDILNSRDIEPPKGLKRAVFERIKKEKNKRIAREKFLLQIGSSVSGISSVAVVTLLGKEILSSEFFGIAALAFSDMRIVATMWQNYSLSLLETLPATSMTVTLLPIFIFMLLLRQYGKLQQNNETYSFKH